MENTLENKLIFLDQYSGQEVIMQDGDNYKYTPRDVSTYFLDEKSSIFITDAYAFLKKFSINNR